LLTTGGVGSVTTNLLGGDQVVNATVRGSVI
jgi:hypothetical protein